MVEEQEARRVRMIVSCKMDVAGPHVPQDPHGQQVLLGVLGLRAYFYHLSITDIILDMELIETVLISVM